MDSHDIAATATVGTQNTSERSSDRALSCGTDMTGRFSIDIARQTQIAGRWNRTSTVIPVL